MIDLYVKDKSFTHEIAELLRAFMPYKKVNILESPKQSPTPNLKVEVDIYEKRESIHIHSKLSKSTTIDEAYEVLNILSLDRSDILRKRSMKNAAKRCVYRIISAYVQKKLDWGILTGIRPTKIVNEMLDDCRDKSQIFENLLSEYFISEAKARLLIETVNHQRGILCQNRDDKLSLYINIPFCTTKCLYCSFPSDTIARCEEMLDPYVSALILEIKSILDRILEDGYKVQTVYIGGGTPTSLPPHLLRRLLGELQKILPRGIEEYTVEGGRPDSLDIERLHILKEYGVNRISINPQTMNENTLKKIGRVHKPEDVIECFRVARQIGFNSINMDVIVGLPGEGVLDIENTMEKIYRLSPDNLTIHTLAIKRGSPLRKELPSYDFVDEATAEKMLNRCTQWAEKMGMVPYYLYRQKYILGNLENIGYAMPEKKCIYNIQMMEERQTVLGFGAGGTSKIFYESENRIERVANVKDHIQYVERIEEMIERKIHRIYE